MVLFYHRGFDLVETGSVRLAELWNRGGLPRSFLAADDQGSYAWRQDYIETFLSRDARGFGITLPPERLRRFWTMLAHTHGGVLNAAALGRALSLDQKTASRYVDILVGAFLVRRSPAACKLTVSHTVSGRRPPASIKQMECPAGSAKGSSRFR